MATDIIFKFGDKIEFRVIQKYAKLGQKGYDLGNLTYFSNLGKLLTISGMAKGIHFKFGNEIKLREHYENMQN